MVKLFRAPQLLLQASSSRGGIAAASPLRRLLASDASAASVAVAKRPTGAGLFQRISSFFVGAGLTALGTQYYIWDELRKSNQQMIQKQKELENRLLKLEK